MLGLIDGDVLIYASMWNTTTLEGAIANANRHLQTWLDSAFCDDYIIALGDPSGKNYRDILYPEYKQIPSRVKARKVKAPYFNELRAYLKTLEHVEGQGIEADDLLGHWAGPGRVIITVDKDLNQVPGLHWSFRTNELQDVSEDEANRFFLRQMLTGDAMDNIPGVPGIGPVKAEQYCLERDTKQLAEFVLDTYKNKFGEEWENYFLVNAKLLWIQRQDYDWFTLDTYRERFQLKTNEQERPLVSGIPEA